MLVFCAPRGKYSEIVGVFIRPRREIHQPIQMEPIGIEDTESPPVVFPMHAWENAIQKNSITVTLINRNVLSRLYEASIYQGDCNRSEEHTSELQSPDHIVCPLLLQKNKNNTRRKP